MSNPERMKNINDLAKVSTYIAFYIPAFLLDERVEGKLAERTRNAFRQLEKDNNIDVSVDKMFKDEVKVIVKMKQ